MASSSAVSGRAAVVLALLASACTVSHAERGDTKARGAGAPAAAPSRSSTRPVQIEMQRVALRLDESIRLDVVRLRGDMESTSRGQTPVFDDPSSYTLSVESGEMSIDMPALSSLLNHYVFAYDGAPLKDLQVTVAKDGRLEQKGKMRKGVFVPFSMKASVGATGDGRLRLHVESIKTGGVPVGGLLGLFGVEVDDLVNLARARGVEVRDNDIVMEPGAVIPPPRMHGRLTNAVLRDDRLVLTYGGENAAGKTARPADPRARNYIYFRGGTIRFGKLTMTDADLQLIDADPKDPFDFYPARYDAQLVAGYSKNTPSKGLKTYMPDYGELKGVGSHLKRTGPPRPDEVGPVLFK